MLSGDARKILAVLTAVSLLSTSVAYAQRIDGPLPRLTITRDLTIEQPADGSEGIGQVRDLVADKSGRVFVLDWEQKRVHVFDYRGKPIRTLGGPGGGPGEFETVARLQILRDTLWVIGSSDKRVSGFDLRTFGVRAFQTGGRTMVGNVVTSGLLGVARNGLVASSTGLVTTLRGEAIREHSFELVSERGSSLAVIGKISSAPRTTMKFDSYAASPPRGNRILITTTIQPILDGGSAGVSGDGATLVLLDRAFFAGSGEAFLNLRILGLRGEPVLQRRLMYTPTPVSDADIDRIVDSISARRPAYKRLPAHYPDRRMVRDSVRRPAYWPPVFRMHVGSDNAIWLQMQGPMYPPHSFIRLSASGVPDGMATLPKGFFFVSATRDHIWGWRKNEDHLTVLDRLRVQ
jgi:hypothetical protein